MENKIFHFPNLLLGKQKPWKRVFYMKNYFEKTTFHTFSRNQTPTENNFVDMPLKFLFTLARRK